MRIKLIIPLILAIVAMFVLSTSAFAGVGQASSRDITRDFTVPGGVITQVDLVDGGNAQQEAVLGPGNYHIRDDIVIKGGKLWDFPVDDATGDMPKVTAQVQSYIDNMRSQGKTIGFATPYSAWLGGATGPAPAPQAPSAPAPATAPASAGCGQAVVVGVWTNPTLITLDGTQGVIHASVWRPDGPPNTEISVIVPPYLKVQMEVAGTAWQWKGCSDEGFAFSDAFEHAKRRRDARKPTMLVGLQDLNAVLNAKVNVIP